MIQNNTLARVGAMDPGNAAAIGGQKNSPAGKAFAELFAMNMACSCGGNGGGIPGAVMADMPTEIVADAAAGNAVVFVAEGMEAVAAEAMVGGEAEKLSNLTAADEQDEPMVFAEEHFEAAAAEAETAFAGIAELQAVLSGVAAVASSEPQAADAGQRSGINPGMQHLVEKMQQSSETTEYDTAAWLGEPVREIMKEIKDNRIIARASAGADPAGNPAIGSETASIIKDMAIAGQPDGISEQGLEGFEAVSAEEASEFADALKQQISSKEQGQNIVSAHDQSQSQGQGAAAGAVGLERAGTAYTAVSSPEYAGTYSQVGNEILAKLEQKGPMEFKMTLQPQDLGDIDVQFKVSEGKLIIDIMAASARTQTLLVSQVDQLVASLGLQNVHVESVSVNHPAQTGTGTAAEQMMAMNGGMEFSHKNSRNRDSDNDGRTYGRADADDRIQTVKAAENSRIVRNLSQRMDYAV